MDRMDEIISHCGEEYILRQLAEECAELSKAALKLIRAQKRETEMLPLDARENFMEEMADVRVMLRCARRLLSPEEDIAERRICRQKEERMYRRLLGEELHD